MPSEWIDVNGGLAQVRNNFDQNGKPAGILGQVMPGAMAEASEHNAKELWKQQKDPKYTPKLVHAPILQEASQEPQVEAPMEEPGASPETPAEELVPDTMAGMWKLLGFRVDSFYDFGIHTISPAGKKPSLEASLRAYRKNMLLTVARALLLKEYDKKFTAEQVKESAKSAWRKNGRVKKYTDVINGTPDPIVVPLLRKTLDEVDLYINGKVQSEAKYMIPWLGQLWCLQAFIKWCKVGQGIEFRKTGWRSTER